MSHENRMVGLKEHSARDFGNGTASALTGEWYLSETKVPLAQARHIALKTYPGKIVSQELEKESGGSGLRYSFVIRHEKVEVAVDAKTGEVLERTLRKVI